MEEFLEYFIQQLRYELDDELEEARKAKKGRGEYERLSTAWGLNIAAVEHADVYEIREGGHQTIMEQMERMYQVLQTNKLQEPEYSWMQPASPSLPLIFLFHEELGFPGNPLHVKALYFHQQSHAQLAESIAYPLSEWMKEELHNPHNEKNTTWLLEALGTEKLPPLYTPTNFVIRYHDGYWHSTPKTHLCLWDACQAAPICNKCEALLQTLSLYFCIGLQAMAGTFQNVVVVDHPYVLSQQTSQQQHSLPQQRVHYIDVGERKVYRPREEGAQQQKEHRGFWTARYDSEEIDENKKAAKSHPRHLRDGTTIQVKKSKKRPYPKLKEASKKTILDRKRKKI